MYKTTSKLPDEGAKKRIDKQQLKVSVYTDSRIYSGCAHCLHWQRLTDLLNGVLQVGVHAHEKFLPLTDITIHSVSERAEMPFASINKAQVLFIRESEDGKVERRYWMVQERLPMTIRVYVPSYTLTGETHLEKGQRLSDILNTEDKFLPMTNVEILSSGGTSESRIGFVAINKERIIYAEEV